jgi:DNA-binding NarL/FixJ family response regulator
VLLHADTSSFSFSDDVYGGQYARGGPAGLPARLIRRNRDAAHVPTVLIVDDDANYRRALTAFLDASFDLDVIANTANGAEAVALAEHLHPDAVVVDVAMPVVNGVEVAEQLRELLPNLAIVLVTGNVGGVDPERVRQLGAATLVVKGDPLPVENALRTLSRRA